MAKEIKFDIKAREELKKGVDELALQIKSIARVNDVPTVENRALARDLYNSTDIDQMIPESYCKIIAVIYAELKKFNINA